jgi:hypothetical protein
MRYKTTNILALMLAFVCLVKTAQAQTDDNPVAYMNSFVAVHEDMNNKDLIYQSAAAHGKRLRRVEKLRKQAVDAIDVAMDKSVALPAYKGDNSLRQASITYINFCHKIFNEDYAHIVDLEEISEESVDKLQAYLLLQEKTDEKFEEANKTWDKAYADFAAKYKVTLIDSKSDKGEKIETANKLNKYFNALHVLFFKCNWENNQLVKSLGTKNVNDIEQCRNALIKYANEGLIGVDTLRSFNGDASMAQTCKESLIGFKKIAETIIPKMTDHYLKEENFNNIKKAFEAKSPSDRTNQDIDAYNKAVKEINNDVNTYNQNNNEMNNLGTQIVNNWNSTEKTFLDNNMPYFKKGKM